MPSKDTVQTADSGYWVVSMQIIYLLNAKFTNLFRKNVHVNTKNDKKDEMDVRNWTTGTKLLRREVSQWFNERLPTSVTCCVVTQCTQIGWTNSKIITVKFYILTSTIWQIWTLSLHLVNGRIQWQTFHLVTSDIIILTVNTTTHNYLLFFLTSNSFSSFYTQLFYF